jgi:exopolysaccharide biosynthesis polyprenyl glycosylphosphotransferase
MVEDAAPATPPEVVARPRPRRFARTRFIRRPAPDVRDISEGQRAATVVRRDAVIRRTLAVADLLAASLALAAAVVVDGGQPRLAIVAAPFAVVVFLKLARLYDRDDHVIRKSTLEQAPGLLNVATFYSLAVWFASGLFLPGGLTKPGVAALWSTLVVGLLAGRFVARRAAATAMSPERCLVIGDAVSAERLRERVETSVSHSMHACVVGRVALQPGDSAAPAPLGPLDNLDYILRANAIERVIIAPGHTTSDELLEKIRLVKALGVKVSVLPRLFEVVGSSMEVDDVDGITLIGLRRYGLPKSSWYVKRAFDIAGATVGLLVLAPLLAGIGLAVKLTSRGPVLFRQPRVGRGGETFDMLKFRTMYDGADRDKAQLHDLNNGRDGLFKIADDPRVTAVGRFLRRTSLDELPQLINVLSGEMSLVGPRPLVEEEDRKIAAWHHRRREGTPGMTGVWQVLGSTRVGLDDMVKLDYLYRANWSLWLDVKILVRTLMHVFSRRGL